MSLKTQNWIYYKEQQFWSVLKRVCLSTHKIVFSNLKTVQVKKRTCYKVKRAKSGNYRFINYNLRKLCYRLAFLTKPIRTRPIALAGRTYFGEELHKNRRHPALGAKLRATIVVTIITCNLQANGIVGFLSNGRTAFSSSANYFLANK